MSRIEEEVKEVKEDSSYILQYLYPSSCADVDEANLVKSDGIVTIKPPKSAPAKVIQILINIFYN